MYFIITGNKIVSLHLLDSPPTIGVFGDYLCMILTTIGHHITLIGRKDVVTVLTLFACIMFLFHNL